MATADDLLGRLDQGDPGRLHDELEVLASTSHDASDLAAYQAAASIPRVAQTFADVLTIAVVHVQPPTLNLALERVQVALAARSVIEQAKGVLSHQRNVDMGAAYQHLVVVAEQRRVTLGQAARMVVEAAQAGESL